MNSVLHLADCITNAFVSGIMDSESGLWDLVGAGVQCVVGRIAIPEQREGFVTRRLKSTTRINASMSLRRNQVEEPDEEGSERIYKIHRHSKPFVAEYVIQEHDAQRAGLHWDLRIAIDGKGHSWAIPRAKMPPLHDRPLLAVQVPTHNLKYFDFYGKIAEGEYGAGKVKIVSRGQLEVMYADDNKVQFVMYNGGNPGKYTLKRWFYKDRTMKGGRNLEGRGYPSTTWALIHNKDDVSPPFVDRPTDKIRDVKQRFDPKTHVITHKYDGTHSTVHIDTKKYGNRTNVISRQEPVKTNKSYKARGGVLHQEDSIPGIRDMEIVCGPKLVGLNLGPVLHGAKINYSTLRDVSSRLMKEPMFKPLQNMFNVHVLEFEDFDGDLFHVEVYHNKGHGVTSGLMNSSPIKARADQAKIGRVRVIMTDVAKYKGKDVKSLPYTTRYALLKEFAKLHHQVEVAEHIPKGMTHAEYHASIVRKKHGEGTIVVSNEQRYGEPLFKVKGKMTEPYTATYYIVGFTEGQGRHSGRIGAILYSDKKNGEPLGKVGGGLSDVQRDYITDHKKMYLGKKVVIESHHKLNPHKVARAPSVHELSVGKEPGIQRN